MISILNSEIDKIQLKYIKNISKHLMDDIHTSLKFIPEANHFIKHRFENYDIEIRISHNV